MSVEAAGQSMSRQRSSGSSSGPPHTCSTADGCGIVQLMLNQLSIVVPSLWLYGGIQSNFLFALSLDSSSFYFCFSFASVSNDHFPVSGKRPIKCGLWSQLIYYTAWYYPYACSVSLLISICMQGRGMTYAANQCCWGWRHVWLELCCFALCLSLGISTKTMRYAGTVLVH